MTHSFLEVLISFLQVPTIYGLQQNIKEKNKNDPGHPSFFCIKVGCLKARLHGKICLISLIRHSLIRLSLIRLSLIRLFTSTQ